MIKCKEGKIKIKGTRDELKAELFVLAHALVQEGKLSKEDIKECMNMANMDTEALEHKLIGDFLKKLFGDEGGDEDGE